MSSHTTQISAVDLLLIRDLLRTLEGVATHVVIVGLHEPRGAPGISVDVFNTHFPCILRPKYLRESEKYQHIKGAVRC